MTPTKSEWKQLYAEANLIFDLAPWRDVGEDQIFGVQSPETGQTGFVSIMGALGEHLAITVYLGVEALYDFWLVHDERVSAERILEIPQLQLSFEDRAELTDKDRKIIKSLGLKYRGRQAWPLFRSYRPGFVPWYLASDEARFLAHALGQTRAVIEQMREAPDLLDAVDDITYLVRVPKSNGDGSEKWTNQMLPVPPPESAGQDITLNGRMLHAVRSQKTGRLTLEADFFMSPMQIQEQKGERPYFGYMLMVVDHDSGMVIGHDVMTAEPSFTDMLAQVPQAFLNVLAKLPVRPQRVLVQSQRTYSYLFPVCKQLEIEISPAEYLFLLEEAKASLLDYLER